MTRKAWVALSLGAVALLGAASVRAQPGHRMTVAEFGAGCSIPSFADWPDDVRAGFVWMGRARYAMDQIVGGQTLVTSAWRPTACNAARDGEDRSRHLRGWAIDLLLRSAQRARLVAWLREIGALEGSSRERARRVGDALRRLTGWRGFVGLRIYSSGSVHLDFGCPLGSTECDPRRADWFDDLYT